jgi:2-keto-4-pentenoate hydratase/2-oxohepta-3-ene-1,7-dioic acid hydratase in catechol pathway
MRWITHQTNGAPKAAVLSEGRTHDLDDDRTLLDLLRAGPDAMAEAGTAALDRPHTGVLDELELLAPLEPPAMRDFLCFLDHYRNATLNQDLDPAWERQPAFYFTNHHAVYAPSADVPVSPGSTMFDFELEVGAVIGKACANLHPDEAGAHIAGYLIFCDWSARDLQLGEMTFGLGPAKGKDGATTLGPVFVTADELADRRKGKAFDLSMQAWVNGDLVTDGNLSQLDWSFAEMVAYASRGTRLVPGEVIGSGTVPRGCLLEHAMNDGDDFRGWLEPGDQLTLEVELMGRMEATVAEPLPVHPVRESEA